MTGTEIIFNRYCTVHCASIRSGQSRLYHIHTRTHTHVRTQFDGEVQRLRWARSRFRCVVDWLVGLVLRSALYADIHPINFSTPGVVILTASAVQDNYGILASFGIGLDFAVGSGVFISTHVAANQVNKKIKNKKNKA